MPGNVGLELLGNIPAFAKGLPVILLTGNPTVETAARSVWFRILAYLTKPPGFTELCNLLQMAFTERRNLRILKDNRRRIQDWGREIERLQQLLQQAPPADRQVNMQSYVRLTLRNLVVGLMELEHLLIHDGERAGEDHALEKQEMLNAVRKTISVLEHPRNHFKSKELGDLRKELEMLTRRG